MAPSNDRIEAAIEKLTNVSIELKQMLAVHELRITNQEKSSGELQVVVEKRREELDQKLKEVYDTIRDRDDKILTEIKNVREEHNKHYNCLDNKFNAMQKYIWLAIGGGMVITWVLSNITNFIKFTH